MPEFRFVHTSDLHLGRSFGTYSEEIRGRMVEARHTAIERVAAVARQHKARHILVAGDMFDTETPSDPVWRQALVAMGQALELQWWIIPGNHDSLAAESLWERFCLQAPDTVHLIDKPEAIEIEPGVTLLPAPASRRFTGYDLTEWMPDYLTPKGHLRIGLAHGSVVTFGGEEDNAETIPVDRSLSARLDYLALGDWHGCLQIGERTWYSGTPEYDRFTHSGRGECLVVTLTGSGAIPIVKKVVTGQFEWLDVSLRLTPEQDPLRSLRTVLPSRYFRRNTLIRVRASGWIRLSERIALEQQVEEEMPEFACFIFDDKELETECSLEDLDAISEGGALRIAAEELFRESREMFDPEKRDIATAALRRLYSYVKIERI